MLWRTLSIKKACWRPYSKILPDFGRLFSLVTEAAQMTQNKKKKQTLGVWGGIKFL
jgi:hypothetical protein